MSRISYEPYKIFEFGRIDLSQDDISRIAPRHLRFLGQSCLAANDISVFLKLLVGHMKREDSSEVIGQLAALTTVIIQRNLQSKIFEFVKIFDDYYHLCVKSNDTIVSQLLNDIQECTGTIKKHRCYNFSKHVRNKITNHYAFTDWHKAAKEHNKSHRFKLYMHRQNGNTFYPFAEEASHLSLYGSKDWGEIDHNEVFEWMADSNRILVSLQQRIALCIFKHYIDEFRLKAELVYVPNSLVIDDNERYPLLGLLNGSGRW